MILLQKWLSRIVLLLLVLFPLQLQASDEVGFRWAILQDTDTGLTALDFRSPPNLSKNTTIQIFLHPDLGTFLYVFLLDSSNEFTPIFPGEIDYYSTNQAGEKIRVPMGDSRFTIVPPAGQEKFYLIASPARLVKVEKIMNAYFTNPNDSENQAKLYNEIRLLRRKHSKLTQFTEKGIPVSGTVRNLKRTRGPEQKETFTASQVTGNGFYSKVLRVNHE